MKQKNGQGQPRNLMRILPVLLLVLMLMPLGNVFSQGPIQVEFVVDEVNPIFDIGGQDDVDGEAVMDPYIIEDGGLHHMFYVTRNEPTAPFAISYATSENGLDWERYEGNPIFEADGTGFDLTSVLSPVVLIEDGMWILYYAGLQNIGLAYGDGIGRATASDPRGPWERLEVPILVVGDVREWDANKIGVDAVFMTDDGYRLYYTSNQGNSVAVGMATSSDGLIWQKYNDPTTDDRKYASSDPIFNTDERGTWDDGGVQTPSIRQTANGYEMVYIGYTNLPQDPTINYFLVGIGYAYSEDGINWIRASANPLHLSDSTEAPLNPSLYETENGLYVMYTMLQQTNRGLIGGRIDRAELIVSDE